MQEEVRHKKEIERRTHPRTKEDFIILYEELEVKLKFIMSYGAQMKLRKLRKAKQ